MSGSNRTWDAEAARKRIDELDLDPGAKAGKLSGGQKAQLALTLALAKRPELLILDEPVASLDPLARRAFLQHLMETVAENEMSVVLSSHLVADLERVCDYLVVRGDSVCSCRVKWTSCWRRTVGSPDHDGIGLAASGPGTHRGEWDRPAEHVRNSHGKPDPRSVVDGRRGEPRGHRPCVHE